ncbi:hypothetical protein VTJ49DRAFT_7496 [Mycothermus thermophilus]|uniref:Vps72/YL1 C-terminal domain-containing protein n=1 Tax=Humicola insolens TaxID=85995 RepID=A0ABR3VPN1_HUMIN
MAATEDEPKSPSSSSSSLDDLSDLSSIGDTGDNDNDSDAEEPPQVEWLATSRSRRSTAGNRMKSLLANEEPAATDSDLELLFAEDEDDAGFTDDAAEDLSDVQMDSSSDDEDMEEKGDELEGEKELERQERERRAAERKRKKAQEAIPARFRKKVRIEQPAARPPRPKKKSERISWLPSPADMPTRASERQTTKLSKQQLHQKMVSDELRRRKQIERMEKKAKQLEAMKKPPKTQAERLAEAAITEKRNAKSLNRWEEAEKQREEERLRKIAALHSRKLDGPVVTFWSGIQELKEGQAKHVGNLVSMEEKAPRKKRQSAAAALAAKEATEAVTPTTPDAQDATKATAPQGVKTEQPDAPVLDSTTPAPPPLPPGSEASGAGPPPPMPALAPGQSPAQTSSQAPVPSPAPLPPKPSAASAAPVTTPAPMGPPPIPPPPLEARSNSSGVLAAPVLALPAGASPGIGQMSMPALPTPPAGPKPFLAAPNTGHQPSARPIPPSTSPAAVTPQPISTVPPATPAPQPTAPPPANSTPTPTTAVPPPPLPAIAGSQPAQGQPHPTQVQTQPPQAQPKPPQDPSAPTSNDPPREGKVTRSCIILQNFDEQAIKDKQVQAQILFGRKMNRLAKPAHPPLCVITNQPARYRDPKTGLPYYNAYAYREIQRVCRGDYKWSRLVEWFLDPSKAVPVEKPAEKPAESVLVPIDNDDCAAAGPAGVVKAEEKDGSPAVAAAVADEPRLAPIEGTAPVQAAAPAATTAAPAGSS